MMRCFPLCARRHTSFAERTSLGEAHIICRRQTSFKKRTFVLVDKSAFFVGRGSWIWTSEWGSQSPLPYRLATPLYGERKSRDRDFSQSRFLVGWVMGLEPTTPGTTIRCYYQLSYTHHMARQKGFEPLTYCLEGSCSILLSYWRIFWSGWWESNPHDQLGRLGFYRWTTPA